MYYVTSTRFNDKTYEENRSYCERNNGLFYGTPMELKPNMKPNAFICVIEMNNSQNKIMGLGLVKNEVRKKNYHKIYDDNNYNRFTYVGKHHISANEITAEYDKKVIEAFENLLFKGSRHLKRAQGITELPIWIMNNKVNFNVIKYFKTIFKTYKKIDL